MSTLDLNTLPKELLTCRPAREGSNIISPIARLSFPTFFEPESIGNDPTGKKKYSCSLLIPPQCDLALLKKAAGEAAVAKWGADKVPEMVQQKKLKTPFLQAVDYKYDGYITGWTLLRPSSENRPTVLDAMQSAGSLIKLLEENVDYVYPGRWCVVTLNAFAYEQKGNKGVSFGLNNVMLLNHDESLSGRAKAEDEFEAPQGLAGAGVEGGAPVKSATIESLF